MQGACIPIDPAPQGPLTADVLATVKERFCGSGKTGEDLFDRYRYLVAESSTGKLIDSAEEELFVIESLLRSFLKGWQLP